MFFSCFPDKKKTDTNLLIKRQLKSKGLIIFLSQENQNYTDICALTILHATHSFYTALSYLLVYFDITDENSIYVFGCDICDSLLYNWIQKKDCQIEFEIVLS